MHFHKQFKNYAGMSCDEGEKRKKGNLSIPKEDEDSKKNALRT
jgi:hypothetical protein